jgi:hypothetical protein
MDDRMRLAGKTVVVAANGRREEDAIVPGELLLREGADGDDVAVLLADGEERARTA